MKKQKSSEPLQSVSPIPESGQIPHEITYQQALTQNLKVSSYIQIETMNKGTVLIMRGHISALFMYRQAYYIELDSGLQLMTMESEYNKVREVL